MSCRSLAFLATAAGLLIGSCCAGVTTVYAAEKVELVLKQEAIVAGLHFTFGDIAVIHMADATVQRQLEQLRLGSVPRVGQAEQYTREELTRALHTRGLASSFLVEWSGARAVKVRAAGQLIDAAELISAAETSLIQTLSQQYEQVKVTLLGYPIALEVPVGNVTFHLRPSTSEPFTPRASVRVDICVDDVVYRSIVLSYAVEANQKVLVAAHDLATGEVATVNDFKLVSRDASTLPRSAYDPRGLQGEARIMQPIQAGEVVKKNSLGVRTAVAKGEAVKLIVIEGSVAIEVAAVALQDGNVGQTVAVKPTTSASTIQANVVSSGVVRGIGG